MVGLILKMVTLGQRSRSLYWKSQNDEEKIAKNSNVIIFESKFQQVIENFITVISIPDKTLLYNKWSLKVLLQNLKKSFFSDWKRDSARVRICMQGVL